MRVEKERQGIIFIFMLGFLVGIIYANMIAGSYVTTTSVFHENYLNQYLQVDYITVDYIFYLMKYRSLPLIILCLMATTRYRKIAAVIIMLWTGFSAGVLAVTAVLCMGAAGMLVCLAALFPHFIFYGVSYLIVIWYCLGDTGTKWNKVKSMVVFLMLIAGIMAEGYLNPWIMKMVISILL